METAKAGVVIGESGLLQSVVKHAAGSLSCPRRRTADAHPTRRSPAPFPLMPNVAAPKAVGSVHGVLDDAVVASPLKPGERLAHTAFGGGFGAADASVALIERERALYAPLLSADARVDSPRLHDRGREIEVPEVLFIDVDPSPGRRAGGEVCVGGRTGGGDPAAVLRGCAVGSGGGCTVGGGGVEDSGRDGGGRGEIEAGMARAMKAGPVTLNLWPNPPQRVWRRVRPGELRQCRAHRSTVA